jgi:hypothetical protein
MRGFLSLGFLSSPEENLKKRYHIVGFLLGSGAEVAEARTGQTGRRP